MRIFKTKKFAKFARKEKLTDSQLLTLAKEIDIGKIDADLGSGVIKQRLAKPGRGKSGSYRCIVIYRAQSRLFFVHGFLKADEDNISAVELQDFKKLATLLLRMPDVMLDKLTQNGELWEVDHGR